MPIKTINIQTIQFKRAEAITWTTKNPVLKEGEPGWEEDTNKLKIGDGLNSWNDLPYLTGGGGGGGAVKLQDLTDVDPVTPTNKHVLVGNGSVFKSRQLTTSDISGFGTYASQASQDAQDVLIANNTANISANASNIAVNTAKVSASGSIATHSDVHLEGIINGQVLKWVAGNNRFEPSSDTAATQLDQLEDVVSADNIDKYVLVANGVSGYTGRALTKADISDLTDDSLSATDQAIGASVTRDIDLTSTSTLKISVGATDLVTFTGNDTSVDFPVGLTTSDEAYGALWNGSLEVPTKNAIYNQLENGTYGHTIEDEGTPLTDRGTLNFVGAGVAVTDDSGNGKTVVTINAGGDALTSNGLDQFASTTSSAFAGVISDVEGTGQVVLNTGANIVNANLNTPSAITLTNGTGLPIDAGTTGNLPVARLNGGTNATSSTFWRGDGVWAAPAGGGGNNYNYDYTEVPNGSINGTNTTFTTTQGEYRSGSLIVYLNGQALIATKGIIETDPSNGIFDFETAPLSGDEVYVNYDKATPLPGIIVESDTTGITGADQVKNIVALTQLEYNAIADPETNYPDTFFIITDAEDSSEPKSSTSSVIDLGRSGGNYVSMASPSAVTSYSTTNVKLGGWAKVKINAASEPTVTGATKIKGAIFKASTDMYMVVFHNGNRTEYYFLDI